MDPTSSVDWWILAQRSKPIFLKKINGVQIDLYVFNRTTDNKTKIIKKKKKRVHIPVISTSRYNHNLVQTT